jgi:hypothetical protein
LVVFEPVSSRVFLEIGISCSQWEGSACTHDGPCKGWGERSFYDFCLLVPNMSS